MISKKVDEVNYRRFASSVFKENNSPLQWEEITELKNNNIYLTFHVAVSIGDYLFIHGGIKELRSLRPSNEFYRINMKIYHIENLTNNESPSLSQHAAIIFSNRYIVLIGGWDGHSRTSGVAIFDTHTLKWLKRPLVEGFPKGAGLSSHTANASITSKSIFPDVIIIGREGGTRIQRRYGNAYRLSCNSDLSKFSYFQLPLNIDSRSGHCTSVINSNVYIVGGRDDKIINVHKMKYLISDKFCAIVEKLVDQLRNLDLKKYSLLGTRKAGRKGHCLIPGYNGFVITGGSTFIDTSPVADTMAFLYTTSSSDEYYFLGSIINARANGSYAISDSGEALMHGGIDVNGTIRSEFLKLKLVE